jgi:hypothetical protein
MWNRLAMNPQVVAHGPELTATSAFLGRDSATENGGMMVVPVTNLSSRWQCEVQSTTFEPLDQNGVSLGVSVIGTFMYASVGQNASGLHSNTCLEPGGTGYFFDGISGAIYTSPGSLHLELFTVDGEYGPPVTSVVSMSYTVSSPDQQYTITIANQGPVIATVYGGYSVYLNDADTPSFWGRLNAPTPGYYDLAPCHGAPELRFDRRPLDGQVNQADRPRRLRRVHEQARHAAEHRESCV